MDQAIVDSLKLRNNKIIDIVQKKIIEKCPNGVDLFAVGGSFISGDFYEKSDLDLVLISENGSAKCLDKCFIFDDVGFDIYTHDFRSFNELATYPNPFVTKLIDLRIISASEFGLRHYRNLQKQLKNSMSDDELVGRHIMSHFKSMMNALDDMKKSDNIGVTYRKLAEILKYAEYIVYMSNRAYVKGGVKRIPFEIARMERLPERFLEIYTRIVTISDMKKLISESEELGRIMQTFLDCDGVTESITKRANLEKRK